MHIIQMSFCWLNFLGFHLLFYHLSFLSIKLTPLCSYKNAHFFLLVSFEMHCISSFDVCKIQFARRQLPTFRSCKFKIMLQLSPSLLLVFFKDVLEHSPHWLISAKMWKQFRKCFDSLALNISGLDTSLVFIL